MQKYSRYLWVGLFAVLFCVAAVFATEVSDPDGILKDSIIKFLSKIKVIGAFAPVIYGILSWILVRVIEVLLKSTPSEWGPNGPSLVWRIAQFLFGKSVALSKAKIKDQLSPVDVEVAKKKLMDETKARLKDRFPILNIDIK